MSKDGNGTSSYERAFKYYYDALNRDTAAIYNERTTANTGNFTTTNGWNENRITYDQNGNLLTLFRDAATQGSGGHTPIDNLSYTYSTSNPNQLASVADATGNNAGFVGGTGTYTYDGNGNLTNEPYKGIPKITYNVLNRTDTIKLSSTQYITYTYDASGNLIRKQAYKSGTTTQITDYIDGFVYNNASGTEVLTYFAMPEGRVMYNSGSFTQEYIITDQQGNARISFNNTGAGSIAKVVQENSYYAFGLIMPGSAVTSGSNKKLYNGGSEWQNDYSNLPDYYQTFNRNYDAALGRWVGVDPKAGSAESMTSYQYAGNNPIVYNDPLGDLLPLPGSHDIPAYHNVGGGAYTAGPLDEFWELQGAFVGGNGWTPGGGRSDIGGPLEYSTGAGVPTSYSLVGPVPALLGGNSTPTAGRDNSFTPPATSSYPGIMLDEVDVNAKGDGNSYSNPFAVNYYSTSYIPDDHGPRRYGASLSLYYKGPGLSSGSTYQFIQTASQTPRHRLPNGKVLSNPFVDGPRDDAGDLINPPFYYTNGVNLLNTQYANSLPDHYGAYYFDLAGSSNPWVVFSAQVTIVINNNGQLTSAGSISWGYFEINLPGIFSGSFITPYRYSPTPNADTQKEINYYNTH